MLLQLSVLTWLMAIGDMQLVLPHPAVLQVTRDPPATAPCRHPAVGCGIFGCVVAATGLPLQLPTALVHGGLTIVQLRQFWDGFSILHSSFASVVSRPNGETLLLLAGDVVQTLAGRCRCVSPWCFSSIVLACAKHQDEERQCHALNQTSTAWLSTRTAHA